MAITKYEIIAKKGDKRITLAFTARKTKQSLLSNMWEHKDQISAVLEVSDKEEIKKATAKAIILTDGTEIMFSGNTKLDVLREAAIISRA